MSPTISWCVFTHNDLPILKATLLHAVCWVDQICILDLGSTDGTESFCKAFLRNQDRYERRDTNTVPALGFDEARRAVSALATSNWIMTGGANTVLDWSQRDKVRPILSKIRRDVVALETVNIGRYQNASPSLIEEAVTKGTVLSRDRHRVICRRGSGVLHRGYLHEELYRGESNTFSEAVSSPLRRFHFQGWGNDPLRQQRYAWMFCNAIDHPELQKYTNRWWYDVFYRKNENGLRANAAAYASGNPTD